MRKVSINIMTYNRWELLNHTLKSIFRQEKSLRAKGIILEVIVINDGGTDVTDEKIKIYPKVKYSVLDAHGYDPNGTVLVANDAAELSSGSIILMNAAECFHRSSNVIERLVKAVKPKHPAFATVINRPGDPNTMDDKEEKQKSGLNVVNTVQYSGISRQVPWFFCGAIMKKDFIELGGYSRNIIPADVEFGHRMIANGYTFEWLEDVIVIHQTHIRG